jgi:hypothetical protein
METKTMKRFLLATLKYGLVAVTASADWAQCLGPNRNAVATDAVLARSWPAGGPMKLWSFSLGAGHGGPSAEGGVGAGGTYGKQARRCGYQDKRRGRGDLVEGFVVMTHPNNSWPAIWFTREYGHLSPSPLNFQTQSWRLQKGQTLRLRYRVALHAGDPKEADLDLVYEQLIKG